MLCHHAWCLGPMLLPFARSLQGHLGHLTSFGPDHANNQASMFLSKSCHHACLVVGVLELEMGKARQQQSKFTHADGTMGRVQRQRQFITNKSQSQVNIKSHQKQRETGTANWRRPERVCSLLGICDLRRFVGKKTAFFDSEGASQTD